MNAEEARTYAKQLKAERYQAALNFAFSNIRNAIANDSNRLLLLGNTDETLRDELRRYGYAVAIRNQSMDIRW